MESQNRPSFSINGRKVVFRPGESILDALIRARIPVHHSCGGHGTCGTCLISVDNLGEIPADVISPRSELEAELARDRGLDDDERLACQTEAVVGLKISVPYLQDV